MTGTPEQPVSYDVAPMTEVDTAAASAGPAPVSVGDDLHVTVPGFSGPLEALVLAVHRRDVDVEQIPVAELTAAYRRRVREREPRPEPREVADFLQLCARLLALKAERLLPDGGLDEETAPDESPVDDPGARLAEYRLFRDAADALLSDAVGDGARSFLSLVVPEVIPVERLAISPERLAAAFRAVLERIPEPEPLPLGAVTFSVEEKVAVLQRALEATAALPFEEVFAGSGSRLEAVACFLALLELLRRGAVRVAERPTGIVVEAV